MWISEREKRKRAIKKELELLKEEILRKGTESLLRRSNLLSERKNGLTFEVPFFDERVIIEIPSFTFRKTSGGKVDLVAKIILLRYLKEAISFSKEKDEPFVNLKELGILPKRATASVEKAFSYDSKGFLRCGETIAGEKAHSQSCGLFFPVLPHVRFLLTFSEAEEEKKANLEVFVPKSFLQIFPPAETVYLVQVLLRKIIKEGKKYYSL